MQCYKKFNKRWNLKWIDEIDCTMLNSIAGAEPTLSGILLNAPPYGADEPPIPKVVPKLSLPYLGSSASESMYVNYFIKLNLIKIIIIS